MSHQPLISVTLPNYNYGRFLEEALQAVLKQTYGNFELLFVDDGSTDGSREIAERFARQDSRIKPVYFEKNQGALAAHANTWSRVTGEIVYQYSSDDSIHSDDFFQLGVDALQRHPSAAGMFGVTAMFGTETGQYLGPMGQADVEGFIPARDFLIGFLTRGFFVPGISSLWRKEAIDAVGGYDHRLGPQTDYFINHVLPARSGVVFLRRHFANARVSQARRSFSSSASLEEDLRRFALCAGKIREHTRSFGALEAEWNVWRRAQAKELLARHTPAPPAAAAG
jgi:glycosyltransferase involved in cell wall biosynthesis